MIRAELSTSVLLFNDFSRFFIFFLPSTRLAILANVILRLYVIMEGKYEQNIAAKVQRTSPSENQGGTEALR